MAISLASLMDDSEPDGGGELPQTFLGRRKAAFLKAPARPSPISLTDEETRQRITRIDEKERKWGLSAAVLAAAVAMLAELPGVLHPKTTHASVSTKPKGTSCAGSFYDATTKACYTVHSRSFWVWTMCVLLLFAVTLFIAVKLRRRSALGFAALMNGLAFETTTGSPILGLPFIVFGGWLLIRAWRVQQYGSPTATKRTAGAAPAPRPVRPVRQPRERKKKTEATASGRPRPEASKRYTPKTPTRKRPTPTE
jgi:hypothetical protein